MRFIPNLKTSTKKEGSDKTRSRRLFNLASNFNEAIKVLPEKKQREYLDEQKEVADCRRKGQTNQQIMSIRLD